MANADAERGSDVSLDAILSAPAKIGATSMETILPINGTNAEVSRS